MIAKATIFVLALTLFAVTSLAQNPVFPLAMHVYWDMNPDADEVTHYLITMDSNFSAQLPTAGCTVSNRTCAQPIQVPDNQNHTVTLRAVNSWGTSDATVLTFRINNPSKPGNIRISK